MQELDKLPDKWYVIVENKKTAAVYKEFFQRDWMYDVGYYYSWNGINYVPGSIPNGTLISFEQFKKWVLKESDSWCVEVTEENKEIVNKWYGAQNVSIGSVCGIANKYGIPQYGKGHNMTMSGYFDKLLTTEEFYEKIGHKVEKKPILPNSAIANKRVEDLAYPDVVHIQCRNDHNKLGDKVENYQQNHLYYLIKQNKGYGGSSEKRSSYENSNYTIYEMDQIIFPNTIVKPVEKWSVGSYVVFLTDEVKTNSSAEITKGRPYRINEKQYDLLYSKSDTKKEFNFFWEQEECRWFPTLEEAEAFSNLIKEKVYSGDLSNYIGRYLEALVDNPHGGTVKKGEYGLIINEQQVNFPYHKGYACSKALSESNLNINYRLMPEGFTPSSIEEVSECVKWKPQIGDWVVTDNLRINDTDDKKYNGTIGQIWKIGNIFNEWYRPVESMHVACGSLQLHNLRKATQQEIDSMSKTADVKPSESKFENMSKDELLEYARKKYPIGTKVKFPDYSERIISQELYWQYKNLISHYECCPILVIKDGEYVWAEIIEMPKLTPSQVINMMDDIAKDVLPSSNNFVHNITVQTQSVPDDYFEARQMYSNPIETHQLSNKRLKFLPIKVELIKVKKLKK